MKKDVIVKQAEEVIPVEVLAESIKQISEGVKKLRNGKLKDKAIILLIHDNCKVGKPAVKAVLDGMETLAKEYLK